MKNKKNILIAGGGTGGHIYPGIAIARAIIRQDPSVVIHFIGTPLGLENQIIPREGFKLHLLKVGQLNYSGSVFSKLKTIFMLPFAFLKSLALLWELKPQFVLGVGGYASGPMVLTARICGFRAAIWEPNAIPGMTNRWLSRFVKKAYVVFDEAMTYLKSQQIEKVGLPVRESIEEISQNQNKSVTQRSDLNILIFGGSQGARAINNIVRDAVQKKHWLNGVKIIHQTGKNDFQSICEFYKNQYPQVECVEYLHDIEKKYQWADLIICRSGASTVAEIAAAAKPAIFIPLPTAADNHQQKNAESLINMNAAKMILQKDLTVESFIETIEHYKNHKDELILMTKELHHFYQPKAAEKIAEKILSS